MQGGQGKSVKSSYVESSRADWALRREERKAEKEKEREKGRAFSSVYSCSYQAVAYNDECSG